MTGFAQLAEAGPDLTGGGHPLAFVCADRAGADRLDVLNPARRALHNGTHVRAERAHPSISGADAEALQQQRD